MNRKIVFTEGLNKKLFDSVGKSLISKDFKFQTKDEYCTYIIGLKGRSYQFTSFIICGNYYLTLSVRIPVLLDNSNYQQALQIATKYTIKSPIGNVEILRDQGPVAVKISIPVADKMPDAEVIEHMIAHGLRLAEDCAGDFFDLVKSTAANI